MSVSVILNVYKRPEMLERQISAIKNQSIKVESKNIHVWYNAEGSDPKDKEIKTYKSNYNTKFFARFMLGLICDTEFVSVFDDDILPGKDWLKNCIETVKVNNGILGGAGVQLRNGKYLPHKKVGWNGSKFDKVTEVSLVGHAWFYRQEFSKFMFEENPPTWNNGEDMFLSYIAQKNGFKTFVPPHPENNKNIWCNLDFNTGRDKNASHLSNPNHHSERDFVVDELIKRGWKL